MVCIIYNCLGAINRGTRANDGKIIGVIHESFLVDIKVDHEISELVVTRGNDLNERKQLLFDNADCFVVMPGGFGTFDELCDYLCARTLNMKGLIGKRCVLVNIQHYYDGIIQQVRKAEEEQLLYDNDTQQARNETDVEECIEWCNTNKRLITGTGSSDNNNNNKTITSIDSTVVTQTIGSRVVNHNNYNNGKLTKSLGCASCCPVFRFGEENK